MIHIVLHGRLGNQMFEYATAYKLAKESNQRICLIEIYDKNRLSSFAMGNTVAVKHKMASFFIRIFISVYERILRVWFRVKKFPVTDIHKARYEIESKMIPVLSQRGLYLLRNGYVNLGKCTTKNALLYGYFQSEKYFSEYKAELLKAFSLEEHIDPIIRSEMDSLKKRNLVCLHIRLGDYVKNPIHEVCTTEYYQQAINKIISLTEDPVFYIFSDEIEKVKNRFDFHGKEIIVENGTKCDFEVLYCMKNCNHFIISNSSFSWWAQYLCENKDKIVISPDRWTNMEGPFDDIAQESWIRISV